MTIPPRQAPSDPSSWEEQLLLLQEQKADLLQQLEEKKMLLRSKPAFRWRSLTRKIRNVLFYYLKKWGMVRVESRGPSAQVRDDERELIRLKREVRKLTVSCFRLEADIIEDSWVSWRGLTLKIGNPAESWMQMVFRLYAKNYRYRPGTLIQHPPLTWKPRKVTLLTPEPREWPTIQLVVPSYQQAAYLERTIRSVIDQKYPRLKLRIHDGGSKDGSREIIQRYGDSLAGWVSERDNGQTEAIQKGFAFPDGEIMAYLNSDDLLLPGVLACVGAYFAAHPEVDVVYGHRVIINEKDQEIGRWYLPEHDPEVLRWADYIPQETMFWRRSLYEKVGGMDLSFRFAMDWDLILRFQEAGAKIVRLPRVMGAFRVHAAQKTSEIINSVGHQEMNKIREKIHGRVVHDVEVAFQTRSFLLRAAHLGRWHRLTSRR